jgi:hypothetical protein
MAMPAHISTTETLAADLGAGWRSRGDRGVVAMAARYRMELHYAREVGRDRPRGIDL